MILIQPLINTGIPIMQMILAKNGKKHELLVATETIDRFLLPF